CDARHGRRSHGLAHVRPAPTHSLPHLALFRLTRLAFSVKNAPASPQGFLAISASSDDFQEATRGGPGRLRAPKDQAVSLAGRPSSISTLQAALTSQGGL